MLTDLLSIMLIFIIFGLVIWLMNKQDDCDKLSTIQPSVPVRYERLPAADQLNLLSNKLEELELLNLSPCKNKLEIVADRLKKMEKFYIKSELLYKDELMQYERAIDWIKSPVEFRNRCRPPNIYPAYSPLTDSDMKQLGELTFPPVDFTRIPVEPSQRSIASGKSSLPLIDQWLTYIFSLITHTLDTAWDIKDQVISWTCTNHFPEHGGLIEYLRRAIVVSAEEDKAGNKTIFMLDFMVPPTVTLDRMPEVIAIGLPIIPLKGFCCIPVKYTESNA